MKTLLQRICWNTRGWRLPSGSTSDTGFPSENGFAHEEWNFQLEDVCDDGFVYGYMYRPPAESKIADAGGQFRVVFFTIHPDTKERLIVGIYHSAEMVPGDCYEELFTYFESNGVFTRRANELKEVTHWGSSQALKEVKNAVKKHWLNIRCLREKIEIFEQYLPLASLVGDQSVGAYFAGFTYLAKSFDGNQNDALKALEQKAPLAEDAYYRESSEKLRVIIPRHNKLSNDFCKWLKKKYGINALQEYQQVDVRFEYNSRNYLAELKICYGVGSTKSIREALGQLLEYNHYPSRVAANEWLIVLDEEPLEKDKKFIKQLREALLLPITIGWSNTQEFLFDREWLQK